MGKKRRREGPEGATGAKRAHESALPAPAPPSRSQGPSPSAPATGPKRPKQKLLGALHTRGQVFTPALSGARAFEADPADHCETPFKAYRDIEPFLFRVAQMAGRTKETLRIYDPFYCEGSVVRHLQSLGFETVYNRNEDFYAVLAAGRVPEHDVVVTNPPFSSDHIERTLQFCAAGNGGRPWLLLLPNFVYKKSSCAEELARAPSPPLFLVPASTYTFWSPGRSFVTGPGRAGAEAAPRPPPPAVGAAGKPTTPFECMWYAWLGGTEMHAQIVPWWRKKYERASGCTLATSPDELPERARPKRTVKRPNPKARKRMRAKGIAL